MNRSDQKITNEEKLFNLALDQHKKITKIKFLIDEFLSSYKKLPKVKRRKKPYVYCHHIENQINLLKIQIETLTRDY